jgi:tripartite-type tricarboxylate transporter receptor subunit TctC
MSLLSIPRYRGARGERLPAKPQGTPPEIIARMNAAMADALQEPMVKQGLSEQGIDYRLSSPEAFVRFLQNEIKR